MADKKPKVEELEREYVIPLREQFRRVPRYKKTNKAIRAIKEFLVKHMKVRDRDLNEVKIDPYLNEEIWLRGIRKPPARIKVKAVKDPKTEEIKVTLAEMPDKLKFKKLRAEKIEKKATEILESKKKTLDRLKEQAQAPKEKAEDKEEEKKDDEKKKEDAKEKKSAVVESTEKMEKEMAKKAKHVAGGKTKAPKRQQRKALAK
jgi:large subunit ribosomal protein L31e